MRVHSFVPVLGLSLFTLAAADSSSVVTASNGAMVEGTTPPSKRAAKPYTSVARQPFGKRGTPAVSTTLPTKWSYLGCYNDASSNRALAGPSYHDDTDMTEEKCIAFCDGHGYSLAGLEFGRECFCGYSLQSSGTKAPELDCNMACSCSSVDELCGAGDRLSVFTNGDPEPTILQTAGDFTSLGCYSDSASARTLTTKISLDGNVRVTDCTSACAAAGFNYAGLEYANECYCGSSISNGGAPIDSSKCNMACTADHSEFCGGPAAINVYKSSAPPQTAGQIPAGWASLSCYTDSPSLRALSSFQSSMDQSSMTTEKCVNACAAAGYTYAGTEYMHECYCGNSIDNGNSVAESGCDMACSGNHAETCGGAGKINIYQFATSCTGYKGCYDGSGLITEILKDTVHECIAACNADPTCTEVQYSFNSAEKNICNLFNVPRASNYYKQSSTSTYCQTYQFFDKTCSN